jgi:hypothetical protein
MIYDHSLIVFVYHIKSNVVFLLICSLFSPTNIISHILIYYSLRLISLLDVEMGSTYWHPSTAQNVAFLKLAHEALRQEGVNVGMVDVHKNIF